MAKSDLPSGTMIPANVGKLMSEGYPQRWSISAAMQRDGNGAKAKKDK